jgi:hypothetical protein
MLPYQLIAGGSFTSDASVARQVVQVSDQPDLIMVRNRTNWGDNSAVTAIESSWRKGMAQDAGQTVDQAVTSGALSTNVLTSNGFRIYNTWSPPTYASKATTHISDANPAVATMSDTGSINVGDVVRLANTTGMLQIAGYDFEVTAVSSNTNITLNFDSQNQAAVASAGDVTLVIPSKMYPRWRYIVPLSGAKGITQATSAVVSMSVAHDFTVGEKVRLKVSSDYGMNEANNLTATVTATSTYTVTLDLDTSSFTAFSLPTSATYAAGVTPAIIEPAGSGPYPSAANPYVSTDAAYDSRNQWQIVMGSSVITETSTVYDWSAWKYDVYTS